MDVGTLRHRVTIQAPIGVLHESQPIDVEESVPMSLTVLPLGAQARETLALGGVQSQTIYTVTYRYREM